MPFVIEEDGYSHLSIIMNKKLKFIWLYVVSEFT